MEKIKNIIRIFIFCIVVSPIFAEWKECYFRGTPNNWQSTPMKRIDENLWSIIVKFGDGDDSGGPRFKISRYQNWEESYPASDCSVEKNSSYEIIFQSEIKAIYLKKLD